MIALKTDMVKLPEHCNNMCRIQFRYGCHQDRTNCPLIELPSREDASVILIDTLYQFMQDANLEHGKTVGEVVEWSLDNIGFKETNKEKQTKGGEENAKR